MIVLDTDVISDLMRPRPAPSLVARLGEVPSSEQATTAVTVGELAYGASITHHAAYHARSRRLGAP